MSVFKVNTAAPIEVVDKRPRHFLAGEVLYRKPKRPALRWASRPSTSFRWGLFGTNIVLSLDMPLQDDEAVSQRRLQPGVVAHVVVTLLLMLENTVSSPACWRGDAFHHVDDALSASSCR
jgi:hypothetical protein